MGHHVSPDMRSQIHERISTFLKQARRSAGLSYEQVDRLMGYEPGSGLKSFEDGEVPAREFIRLTQAYGVSVLEVESFLGDLSELPAM